MRSGSPSARRWLVGPAIALIVAVGSFACSGSKAPTAPSTASVPPTPSAPTPTAVTITGTAPLIGATAPFTATALCRMVRLRT